MFARSISLILIVALIACPLWCGNGACHAHQCCSARQSAQMCPEHGTCECCCDQPSPNSPAGEPCRCPDDSACQGICGGAIFEKPCQLDLDAAAYFMSPRFDDEAGFQLAFCHELDIHHLWHFGESGNYGRSLRTRHMSFLC